MRLEIHIPDGLSEPHLAEVGNASFPTGTATSPPPLFPVLVKFLPYLFA